MFDDGDVAPIGHASGVGIRKEHLGGIAFVAVTVTGVEGVVRNGAGLAETADRD